MIETLNEEMENTTVRVQLEPKDVFWLNFYFLWKKMYRFILVSSLLFTLGLYSIFTKGLFLKNIILLFPFLFIIFVLLSTLHKGKRVSEKHGNRIYTINKREISFVSEEIQGTFGWSKIINALKTKRYIYLFLTTNSALIFPLHSFNDNQLEKFMECIPTEKGKSRNKRIKKVLKTTFLIISLILAVLVVIGGYEIIQLK